MHEAMTKVGCLYKIMMYLRSNSGEGGGGGGCLGIAYTACL